MTAKRKRKHAVGVRQTQRRRAKLLTTDFSNSEDDQGPQKIDDLSDYSSEVSSKTESQVIQFDLSTDFSEQLSSESESNENIASNFAQLEEFDGSVALAYDVNYAAVTLAPSEVERIVESDESLETQFNSSFQSDQESEVDSYDSDFADESETRETDDIQNVSSRGSDTETFSDDCDDPKSKQKREFQQGLTKYVIEVETPRTHVTKLLKLLKTWDDLKFLPGDYRSLLKTPRVVKTKEVPPGS